jgi:hypothetical protein
MSDLVQRLCAGDHRVEVVTRPERTIDAFKASLDRGYIHIKFTETKGGTELGVRVDPTLSELATADFPNQRGQIRVVGRLTLDYVPVRCVADIDIPSLSGTGRLEIAAE